MFSHRIHRIHRTDWQRYSPTEFTEFTERTGRDVLPQISQILTERTGRGCSPTEFTEFTEQTGRDVLPQISQILTEQTGRDVLPQNSQNSQNRLVEMFSHRFHGFSQMVRVWISVNSVYSVGLPMSPVNLCKSVQSVGGLFSTLLQNRLVEMFSHRIHGIHRTDWQRYSPTDFTDSHR